MELLLEVGSDEKRSYWWKKRRKLAKDSKEHKIIYFVIEFYLFVKKKVSENVYRKF